MLTNKYLKDNDLLAVPFDKGVGICVMSKETYTSKIKAITDRNLKNILTKEVMLDIRFL